MLEREQITPAMDSSTAFSYRTTTIAGKQLAYVDQGSGYPVLLGHSYLWTAEMWRPQIEVLSRHFRVIAPDLWGHGRSEGLPAGTADIGDLAAHHLALLDALGIDECHVVGLSVGGMWSAALAQRAPERVRKLVLMDTFVGAEPAVSRTKYLGMLAMIERDRKVAEHLLDMIVPMFFSPWMDADASLCRQFRAALRGFSADQLVDSIVPLGRIIFERAGALDRLHTLNSDRTLVVVGQSDIPRPVTEAVAMAHIIDCPIDIVPDAGHISNLENPDIVNQILTDFLLDKR